MAAKNFQLKRRWMQEPNDLQTLSLSLSPSLRVWFVANGTKLYQILNVCNYKYVPNVKLLSNQCKYTRMPDNSIAVAAMTFLLPAKIAKKKINGNVCGCMCVCVCAFVRANKAMYVYVCIIHRNCAQNL